MGNSIKYKLFSVMLLTILFLTYDLCQAGNENWIGKRAPDFKLQTVFGNKSFSLKSEKGKIVIIDFWASWCAPCKKSLPKLEQLQSEYNIDLKIFAINIDDDVTNAQIFLKQNRINLTALYDKNKSIVEIFDIEAMPTAFIIDRDGIIRFIHVGYTENSISDFIKEVKKLL